MVGMCIEKGWPFGHETVINKKIADMVAERGREEVAMGIMELSRENPHLSEPLKGFIQQLLTQS